MEPREERADRNVWPPPSMSNPLKHYASQNFSANDSGCPISPAMSQIFGGSQQELQRGPSFVPIVLPRSASELNISSSFSTVTTRASDSRSISEPALAPPPVTPQAVHHPEIETIPNRVAEMLAKPVFMIEENQIKKQLKAFMDAKRRNMKKYFNINIPYEDDEDNESISGSSPSNRNSNTRSMSFGSSPSPELSKVSSDSSSISVDISDPGSGSSLDSSPTGGETLRNKLDVLRTREKMLRDEVAKMNVINDVYQKMNENRILKMRKDIDKKQEPVSRLKKDQQELIAKLSKIEKEFHEINSTSAAHSIPVDRNNKILQNLLGVNLDGHKCGDKNFCDAFHKSSCFPTSPEKQEGCHI